MSRWPTPSGRWRPPAFASDAENLYFHLVYDRLIALDEAWVSHGTRLGIDVDNNASTGQIVGDFQGADVVVHLQDRYVSENASGGTTEQHSLNDRYVRMAPTYGGIRARGVALGAPSTACPVSGTVRWTVRCGSGQQVSGEVALSNAPAIPMATPLERAEGTEVRVAFWNMNRRLDEASAAAAMGRILQAVQPDVIGMSEVEDFTEAQVGPCSTIGCPSKAASGTWPRTTGTSWSAAAGPSPPSTRTSTGNSPSSSTPHGKAT